MVENFLKNSQEIFTVSQLNKKARQFLEKKFSMLWVEGEVSNFTCAPSGHWYFSLKDANSEISCAMFLPANKQINFEPKDGDKLLVNGNISIYEARGRYQLKIDYIELAGQGALLRAFEELKNKLEKEGLFDEQRKKTIPYLPINISVVTSPAGAVLQDIIKVLSRRSPLVNLTTIPTSVQGESSSREISLAIKKGSALPEAQVLILARGGGSMEDLWGFNTEIVARAIDESQIPVVSAIGHETDFTIADFVADYRAPTPSIAAEIISESHVELKAKIDSYYEELLIGMNSSLKELSKEVNHLKALLKHPKEKLIQIHQKIDQQHIRMKRSIDVYLLEIQALFRQHLETLLRTSPLATTLKDQERNKLLKNRLVNAVLKNIKKAETNTGKLVATLEAVSPLGVLGRGYAIISSETTGKVIRKKSEVRIGEKIKALLGEGKIQAKVIKKIDEE